MNESNKPTGSIVSDTHSPPTSKSYSYLIRISQQLGSLATKSLVDAKTLLRYDALSSSTGRVFQPEVASERASGGVEMLQQQEEVSASSVEQGVLDSAAGLRRAVEQSHEILASANTVFPVKLFPDTVFIDRTKVTIIRRSFFWSSDVMSIRIEDVLNVSATVGPLFGSLTVASRVMSTIDHFRINHFWRNDAINMKHIIQGYVIAQHNHLDTKHLSREELVKTLIELGHDSSS